MSARLLACGGLCLVVALAVAAGSSAALHQGFDLVAHGAPLLAARQLMEGTAAGAATTPLADVLLAGWLLLAGAKVSALALSNTILTALAAGLGCWLLWPRAGVAGGIAWGVVCLAAAPVPLALGIALAVAVAFEAMPSSSASSRASSGESSSDSSATSTDASAANASITAPRRALVGAGWVLIASLDPRLGIAMLPLVLFAVPRAAWTSRAFAGAIVAAAVVVLLVGWVAVGPGANLTRAVVEPIRSLGERVMTGEALRFARTAFVGMWLSQPFGGWAPTGETLAAAWPGHGELRATALRIVAFVPWIGLAWQWRIARKPSTTSSPSRHAHLAAALFAVAALSLLVRGDVNGLRAAMLPASLALIVALATARRTWIGAGLVAVLALPLAAETLWLSAHAGRSTLATWEDPRGGVLLAQSRVSRWDEIRRQLVPRAGELALIWPTNPGLHWMLGTTPLTPDDARSGGVESDRRVAAALAQSTPRLVLLGQDEAVLGHRLIATKPRTWAYLRDRHRLAGQIRVEHTDFRLFLPYDGQSADPLAQRLPMVELTLAGELSPALRQGFQVGQSFRMGSRDLEGFAVRARTRSQQLSVDIRIQVWQRGAGGFDTALLSERVSTTVAGDGSLLWFRAAVPATAHQDLAITLELRNEIAEEIRLDWYVHDEAHEVDFYPEGTALLGLTPVAADLYFLVY